MRVPAPQGASRNGAPPDPSALSIDNGGGDGCHESEASGRQGRAHHRRGLRHRPGDGGAVPWRGREIAATDRNEAGLAALKADADLALAQDVTDEARWREVVDAVVAAFGRLDILVNSAGIGVLGNIETTTLADWRKVNAVNVEGTFLGCREAVRAMKETGGGSIVNLSSVAGVIGDASSAAYCASKGAVRMLTKSAALHCARAGYKIPREFGASLDSPRRRWCWRASRLGEGPPARAARASCAPRRWGAWARQRRSPHHPLSRQRRSSFTTGAEFMVNRGLRRSDECSGAPCGAMLQG